MIFVGRRTTPPGWVERNGVAIPFSYAAELELRRRLFMIATATWEDVSGTATSPSRLEELAAELNAEAALTAFSVLATFLHNRRGNAGDAVADQIAAATELFPPAIARQVVDMLRSQNRGVWLHEEQLLAAMRLVILHGQEGRMQAAPDQAVIAELLLGINDHIRIEGRPDETTDQQGVRMVLRPLGMLAAEQERYLIPRFQDLLLVRARGQTARRGGLDLDAAFMKATNGLSLEQYLAAALVYSAPFVGVHDVKTLISSSYREILGQYERRHKNPDVAHLCAEQFVGTMDWYRERFSASQAGPLAFWDYMPFKERPVIRLEEGSSPIPLSFTFLLQKLATGPFWLLHAYFAASDPERGVQNFKGVWGTLFEDYAQDALVRTFALAADALFVREKDIIGGGTGIKKPDGVLQQGSALVVFESSATVLSDAVVVASDPVRFDQEISTKHRAKAAQLHQAVDALATGRIVAPGVDMSRVRAVYPVLLLLYPFPQHLFTVKPLRDVVIEGPIQNTGISMKSLTIMTAEEMEIVEPLVSGSDATLPSLLDRKASRPVDRDTSLKNFLFNQGIAGAADNPNMKQLYDERLKSPELRNALHELFVLDDDPGASGD
jgi:hypothetical protein